MAIVLGSGELFVGVSHYSLYELCLGKYEISQNFECLSYCLRCLGVALGSSGRSPLLLRSSGPRSFGLRGASLARSPPQFRWISAIYGLGREPLLRINLTL